MSSPQVLAPRRVAAEFAASDFDITRDPRDVCGTWPSLDTADAVRHFVANNSTTTPDRAQLAHAAVLRGVAAVIDAFPVGDVVRADLERAYVAAVARPSSAPAQAELLRALTRSTRSIRGSDLNDRVLDAHAALTYACDLAGVPR